LLVGKDDLAGDLIEAVVGLPPALFFNTGIAAAVVVLNKKKPAEMKNKVIFIDASEECDDGDKMSRLRDKDIEKITKKYNEAKQAIIDAGEQTAESLSKLLDSVAVDKYLRVVDMSEIEANEFNLNISRYIDTSEVELNVNISEVLDNLTKINAEMIAVDNQLNMYLDSLVGARCE
ncbi:SAM-dependent methyltransferase, partial [Vibrio lentus]